jgi:hypothetical protein
MHGQNLGFALVFSIRNQVSPVRFHLHLQDIVENEDIKLDNMFKASIIQDLTNVSKECLTFSSGTFSLVLKVFPSMILNALRHPVTA